MKAASLRRLIHAATVLVLVPSMFDVWLFRWLLWSVAATILVLDITRTKNAKFDAWLTRIVPVFRERESDRISGASFLWLGYSLVAFFPLEVATIGILAAGLADPAASLVGSRWGSGMGKGLVGSTACFFVIITVTLGFSVRLPVGLVAALVGTLLERFPGPFDDNLLLAPGVAGAILVVA